MRVIEDTKTVYFWGARDVFSNHYTFPMEVDGLVYNCSEQYFMVLKALLFNDEYIANEILKAFLPKEQKALGRKVKNFNESIWNKKKYDLMYDACYRKFHNTGLSKYLEEFRGYKFVEASPYDNIWGVGLSEHDDAILDEANWLGQNLLGKILTDIFSENPSEYNKSIDDLL